MRISKFALGLGTSTCLGLAATVYADSNGAQIGPCDADFNEDALVDGADLGQILLVFGQNCSNCCEANGGLGCDDDKCEAIVCGLDPFCCDVAWDGICANEALANCGEACGGISNTPPCNADFNDDGIVDGSDLGQLLLVFGKDCNNCCFASLGLGCNDDKCEAVVCGLDPFCCNVGWDNICAAEAAAFCGDLCGSGNPACDGAEGDCCVAHDGVGCNDSECCILVCALDPVCCDMAWDQLCANSAESSCGCVQPDPCDTATGDCCTANGGLGCNDPGCCKLVCSVDPFCCDVAWDGICATVAADVCGTVCGNKSNCCTPNGGQGCDNPECEAIVCAIDPFCCEVGWDNACTAEAGDLCGDLCAGGASNCCVSNGGQGCDDTACTKAVCAVDPFCCAAVWDAICAGEAIDLCAVCGGG